MAPITAIHESLPYIDPEPTPLERAAAESLIAAERSLVPDDPHHALLPPPPPSTPPFLTPLLQSELSRLSAATDDPSKAKLAAPDFTRYEAPDEDELPTSREALESTLARAYTSQAYIASRRTHLALLDAHGKNAWLVGNWQLEAELQALERELAAARREIDLVTLARKELQQGEGGGTGGGEGGGAGAEMAALEAAWRAGVGRVLEAEAAAEGLRREVLELRKGGVRAGGE